MGAVRACFAPSIRRLFVRARVPICSHWETRPDQHLFYSIFLAPDLSLMGKRRHAKKEEAVTPHGLMGSVSAPPPSPASILALYLTLNNNIARPCFMRSAMTQLRARGSLVRLRLHSTARGRLRPRLALASPSQHRPNLEAGDTGTFVQSLFLRPI